MPKARTVPEWISDIETTCDLARTFLLACQDVTAAIILELEKPGLVEKMMDPEFDAYDTEQRASAAIDRIVQRANFAIGIIEDHIVAVESAKLRARSSASDREVLSIANTIDDAARICYRNLLYLLSTLELSPAMAPIPYIPSIRTDIKEIDHLKLRLLIWCGWIRPLEPATRIGNTRPTPPVPSESRIPRAMRSEEDPSGPS